jgi:hypothetical protein
MQPMKNRLYVERIPPPEQLIVLTDVQTVRYARVLAIGKEVQEVKVGDIVSLPGIAAEQPDFAEGDKIFVTEEDCGFKLN